jgi:hypothetical protein
VLAVAFVDFDVDAILCMSTSERKPTLAHCAVKVSPSPRVKSLGVLRTSPRFPPLRRRAFGTARF